MLSFMELCNIVSYMFICKLRFNVGLQGNQTGYDHFVFSLPQSLTYIIPMALFISFTENNRM